MRFLRRVDLYLSPPTVFTATPVVNAKSPSPTKTVPQHEIGRNEA